jgi:hypothetical protein
MYKRFTLLLGIFLGIHALAVAQTPAPQQTVLVQERVATTMTILPAVSTPLPAASFELPQNPGKSPAHFTRQFAGTYERDHSLERLPTMEKFKTLSFMQSSLPLTQLWSGRLHLDAFQNTLHFQNQRSVHLSGLSVSFHFGQGARAELPTQSWRSLSQIVRTALN